MKQYELAKKKIVQYVQKAKKQMIEGKVDLQDLIYSVQLYHEPQERIRTTATMPQPYQCAMQLIDNGEKISRRSIVQFLKVKPFKYKGRLFTVKPFNSVKSLSEVNKEDYIRNLTSALEQTFEPMGINLETGINQKLSNWFSG
jgi:DNA polymerase elongation subunit (family B)